MIENLGAVLAAEPKLFRSQRLLNELRTFVRFPDGGSGAAVGTHDDCVMAMAIALGARRGVAGSQVETMGLGVLPTGRQCSFVTDRGMA
jgi:hypothetical protein